MAITWAYMLNEQPYLHLSCIFEYYCLLTHVSKGLIQHCKHLLAFIKRKQAIDSKHYSFIRGQAPDPEIINSFFSHLQAVLSNSKSLIPGIFASMFEFPVPKLQYFSIW